MYYVILPDKNVFICIYIFSYLYIYLYILIPLKAEVSVFSNFKVWKILGLTEC